MYLEPGFRRIRNLRSGRIRNLCSACIRNLRSACIRNLRSGCPSCLHTYYSGRNLNEPKALKTFEILSETSPVHVLKTAKVIFPGILTSSSVLQISATHLPPEPFIRKFQPGAKLQQARLIGASDAVNRRRELQLLRASVGDCDPPLMVENGTRRLRGGGHPASVINIQDAD